MLQSLQSGLSTFFSYLPQLIGALVVLLVGFLIAFILRKIITKALDKARLDDRLTTGSGGNYVQRFSPQGSPALLVGKVLFWVIMLFVISSAISTLGVPALTGFMDLVLSYLPRVIAALLIVLVAAAVAGAIGGVVQRTMGDTPTGRIVRTAAPALVMAIAVFMVLNQLGIAEFIVNATFIALIGAVALGSALAFGLGGRDAAADLINSGYRKAQQEAEQVEADVAAGRDRSREAVEARQATSEIPPQHDGRHDGAPTAGTRRG